MVDEARIKTMRKRLGEASSLVDSDKFLPMFRNRQIHYEDLFNFSIGLSKRKSKPSHYFTNIWSPKNLKKTIDWLTKLLNSAKSKATREYWENKKRKYEKKVQIEAGKNTENLKKLHQMLKSSGLRS